MMNASLAAKVQAQSSALTRVQHEEPMTGGKIKVDKRHLGSFALGFVAAIAAVTLAPEDGFELPRPSVGLSWKYFHV